MATPKLSTQIYFGKEDKEVRRTFGQKGLTIEGVILPKVKRIRFVQKGDCAIRKAQRPKRIDFDSEVELVVSTQQREVTEVKLILWV